MLFATFYQPDFACWAAQRLAFFSRSPTLGSTLIVQRAGRVVARSRDLAGCIELGWPIERAQALAPQARVQAYSEGVIQTAWELALEQVQALTPWFELVHDGSCAPAAQLAVDSSPEAVLAAVAAALRAGAGFGSILGAAVAFRAAQRAAALVQAQVQAEHEAATLALQSGFQAGLGADRVSSLLAALTASPHALVSVPSGCEADFLNRLPLAISYEAGVSRASIERLGWLGFATLADLRRLTRAQLTAQLADGGLLHALVGRRFDEAISAYEPPPRIARRAYAEPCWLEPGEYEPVLVRLLEQALGELDGRRARLVQVALYDEAERRFVGRRWAHEPTSQLRTLHPLMLQALRAARRELQACHPVRLRGGEANLREPLVRKEASWGEVESIAGAGGVPLAGCELILAGLSEPLGVQASFLCQRRPLQEAVEQVECRNPGASLRYVLEDPHAYLPERAYRVVQRRSPGSAAATSAS
jgi:hypothetical protein